MIKNCSKCNDEGAEQMQLVFHASAHAVKGANKAQDPRGVNGHGEGSTDESGRCGTTLSFVLFFWSFTTPLSFRTATGSCSQVFFLTLDHFFLTLPLFLTLDPFF